MAEGRVISHQNITDIGQKLQIERIKLQEKVIKALSSTRTFTDAATGALGEISVNEAIEAIADFFRDELRKR